MLDLPPPDRRTARIARDDFCASTWALEFGHDPEAMEKFVGVEISDACPNALGIPLGLGA